MRVLQVIHQFPPFSSQGSEVYCRQLARELQHTADVAVFHISNPPGRWPRGLRREVHDGLRVYHCVDRASFARLAAWPNPLLRESFATTLAELQPEVVHFHNYLSLGDDLVGQAKAAGAAVVYTLHDYGLICPNTLLLRDDGRLCGKADPDFFQDCCPVLIRTSPGHGEAAPLKARAPSLARWQLYRDQQNGPVRRPLLRVLVGGATRTLGDPRTRDVAAKRSFFLGATRRIFAQADRFIAPSRFLLERYVQCGLPRNRVVHLRNGMQHFAAPERAARTGPVRFGYIGSLHPHKGVELLLRAFLGLRGEASLHVHGSAFHSPVSHSYWSRIRSAANSGHIHFHGAYQNDQVREILAGLDVVVVPSLWYENSPLTIQEAFLAAVPVITAGEGGMAEQVQHGRNGLHFRLGDVADLRARLQQVVDRPELIAELRQGIPPVPDMREHAAAVLQLYHSLRQPAVGV